MQEEWKTATTEPGASSEGVDDRVPMSRRIFLMGIIMVPLMIVVIEYGEIVRFVEMVTTALMLLVTAVLLILLAVNAALKRWAPRWRFTRAELLFLFVMLTIAGNIAGVGMMQMLVPLITYMHHFATPENKWGQFLPYVQDWMIPDKEAIAGFWRGQTTFYTAEHINAWLGTIIIWSLFVLAFVSFTLFLNILLRRQWIDRERLAFPIVYFPLELTKEGKTSLFRQKLLWVGFIVPVVLQTLAGLNAIYPSMPFLPIKPYTGSLAIGRFFGAIPDNPFGDVSLAFYPLAIGIAYFVQLDVLFSAWFFYWFAKLEDLACILLGFRGPEAGAGMNNMPYLSQQSLGAFVALGLVAIWLARRHLAEIFTSLFKKDAARAARGDFISYRTAVFGLLASGAFLFGFFYLSGVSLIILIMFLAIFFLTVIGYTRIRAEAGLPWAFGPNHPPHIFLTWAVGPINMSPRTLTALNYYTWMGWDWRGTTMPYQMEGLKIASSANLRGKDMVKGILTASIIAIIATFITLLALYYRFGGESGSVDDYRAQWVAHPIGLLRTYVESGENASVGEIGGGVAGAAIVLSLAWMRSRFLWWPFHPVGYALCGTFTPTWLWCPLFVAWLAKSLVLRYGGMRLYRRGIPFAIGLILGDYVMTAVWAFAGLIAGRYLYVTFPL